MRESVEQAALRRAQGRDDADALVSLMNRIVLTVEGLNALDDCRRDDLARHDREIAALHAENAELRDGLLALSNRIEAVTRTREQGSGFCTQCDRPRNMTGDGKCDVCGWTIVGVPL